MVEYRISACARDSVLSGFSSQTGARVLGGCDLQRPGRIVVLVSTAVLVCSSEVGDVDFW